MDKELQKKYVDLKDYLQCLGSVAVAFSSGVDSTFLLKVAHDVLKDKAVAITLNAAAFPEKETNSAKFFCQKEKIKHIICGYNPLDIEGFADNPPDRCYICKKVIFSEIKNIAKENNVNYVCEGSNLSDNGDYRPGLKAIKELDVKSPLQVAGLYKSEIRELSKYLGLPTWDKPSRACLASRFAYGETITKEKLVMVDKAEDILIRKGYVQSRVRVHGNMARIELLPEQIQNFVTNDGKVVAEQFKEIGFSYVTLDLQGYRTGSMNEVLTESNYINRIEDRL